MYGQDNEIEKSAVVERDRFASSTVEQLGAKMMAEKAPTLQDTVASIAGNTLELAHALERLEFTLFGRCPENTKDGGGSPRPAEPSIAVIANETRNLASTNLARLHRILTLLS